MTYVAGSYSMQQQVYAFNQIINVAFGVTEFATLPELQQFVNTVLTSTLQDKNFPTYMGNDWQMLWGPMLFSNNPGTNSTIADNAMALFYSPTQKAYVIAIAGTNIDSAYDWLQEDFNVTQTITWADVMGTGFNMNSNYSDAAISVGSHLGLQALLGMGVQTNNTMISALSTSLNGLPSGSTAQVYVSGHSLGGALSPVMALYLHDMQQLTTNWNTKGYVTQINAMPTAGPTPGETNFAAYYSYQCGQKLTGSASISYNSVYNPIDIVPHAWEKDEIGEIAGIYSGNIPSTSPIGSVSIGAFLKGCNTSKKVLGVTIPEDTYTQVSAAPAVRTALSGSQFNTTIDDEITKKTKGLSLIVPTPLFGYTGDFINMARFLVQAGYQHTVAYSGDPSTNTNGLLQVVEVVGIEQGYKKQNLPSGQTETQLHQAAIARVTGLDLQVLDTSELPAAQSEAK